MAKNDSARFDRFMLKEEIASTSRFRHYLAVDSVSGHEVELAIARDGQFITPPDPARIERLKGIYTALSHPKIAQILDVGCTNETLYIVTARQKSKILSEYLSTKKRGLPVAEVATVLRAVAAALDFVHARGILHGNVTAESVSLDNHGNAQLTRFAVFAAFAVTHAPKMPEAAAIAYEAPEAVDGFALDYRGDLYGLAVVVYEAICGRRPFDGKPPEIQAAKLIGALTNPTLISREATRELDCVLAKALSPVADERYQSGRAFSEAFDAACGIATPAKAHVDPVHQSRTVAPQFAAPRFASESLAGNSFDWTTINSSLAHVPAQTRILVLAGVVCTVALLAAVIISRKEPDSLQTPVPQIPDPVRSSLPSPSSVPLEDGTLTPLPTMTASVVTSSTDGSFPTVAPTETNKPSEPTATPIPLDTSDDTGSENDDGGAPTLEGDGEQSSAPTESQVTDGEETTNGETEPPSASVDLTTPTSVDMTPTVEATASSIAVTETSMPEPTQQPATKEPARPTSVPQAP